MASLFGRPSRREFIRLTAASGLVAVADVYDGRLTLAKETWGDHIFTTRDDFERRPVHWDPARMKRSSD